MVSSMDDFLDFWGLKLWMVGGLLAELSLPPLPRDGLTNCALGFVGFWNWVEMCGEVVVVVSLPCGARGEWNWRMGLVTSWWFEECVICGWEVFWGPNEWVGCGWPRWLRCWCAGVLSLMGEYWSLWMGVEYLMTGDELWWYEKMGLSLLFVFSGELPVNHNIHMSTRDVIVMS